MARVFLSYATPDRAIADEVASWLRAAGHESFLDSDLHGGISVGEDWEQRLYGELRRADAVIPVVTSSFVASTWCSAELAIARVLGCRLIPLDAEADVVHPLMQNLQYAGYQADPQRARDRVLQAVRLLDDGGGAWREGDNPFPGLEPFTAARSRVFLGRAAEAREVGNRLRAMGSTGGMLAIVGPSGCGKSSLLNAAVVPLLGSDPAWLTVPGLVPGSDPLPELARALTTTATRLGMDWSPSDVLGRLEAGTNGLRRVADDLLLAGGPGMHPRRLLVTVDQAEELFTRTTPAARQRFAELLGDAVAGPVQVVAAMRSEFLDDLRDLAGRPIEAYVLAPLNREMLRDVIEQPAKVARLRLDDGLAAALVADTGSGEALPLLAFTLRQLADGLSAGGTLSLSRYHDLGGVSGALTRHADAALTDAVRASGLTDRAVLAGLTRLVTVDDTGRRARRRITLTSLADPLRVALQVFVDRRLLLSDTDDDSQVWLTVAHEALLTGWRPLETATADITVALRTAQAAEQAAAEWDSAGRPEYYLWDPERLTATLVTLGMTGDPTAPPIVELDDRALAFLDATGRRRRRRPWRRDRPLKDQTLRTPPTARSNVADPPDEAVADLPDEAVTDPLLSAAVAGIDQHSGVLSDLESAEDRLGVTDDVRSIARMLVALNTTPPLSIALLGNWGCGKSSFMRQVIERVDALAAASKPNPRGSAYATNVRQVRFNAWHYSDDHLWGGLVEHLFRELGDRRRDPNEGQRDDVQAELASEQARLDRLTEDLRAVDAVTVDAGWLGWLRHPFRDARVLRAVGRSLRDEIRAPKPRLIGLGLLLLGIVLILLGAGLVVGFDSLGQEVIGWVAGTIAVVSGLLSSAAVAWRHVEAFTREARAKLQDEKKESEDSIRNLEGQLDLIDPARRLENLLSKISSTDRYERYRGLTGRIRHDLDQLSRDLAADQERWATEGTGVPPPLQRIILYVDDLDRCTSSRVVEVLQAVNLLLSMPLFVVVVAVDPRWLLLALEEHHGMLLNGSSDARFPERRVRSLDYLDKIFHIPYAVRPMSHQGADYLRSLLPPADESEHDSRIEEGNRDSSPPTQTRAIASDLDRGREEAPTHHQGVAENEEVAVNQEAATNRKATAGEATADEITADEATADEITADEITAGEITAGEATAVQGVVADRDVARSDASAIVQPEAIDLTGRELRLQKAEIDFLPLLAPLLSTPRAVKKLTNLYRLMRIAVPKDQLAAFVGGDDGGEYQAAALLLTAVVGAPVQAESFLLALSSATADAGRDIVDVLADLSEPPFANLLAERISLIRKTLPVHGDVETYQKWVNAVARYSFETYHRFSGD